MSMAGTLPRLEPPAAVFLARHGLSDACMEPLPSDASPRSYCRVAGEGKLLMEDRTDPVGYGAFIRLARHLNSLGLSAPRIYGSDPLAPMAGFLPPVMTKRLCTSLQSMRFRGCTAIPMPAK